MERADFQKLTTDRIADVEGLLAINRWSAAYYLAGYAVECALKSCVLVRLTAAAGIVFEDKRYSEKCWSHNLEQLVDLAGLKSDFTLARKADLVLFANWEFVKDWSESSRYRQTGQAAAEELFNAITNLQHGVLPWIQQRW